MIALLGSVIQTLGAATGIPFGAYAYTDSIGQRIFNLLPWPSVECHIWHRSPARGMLSIRKRLPVLVIVCIDFYKCQHAVGVL